MRLDLARALLGRAEIAASSGRVTLARQDIGQAVSLSDAVLDEEPRLPFALDVRLRASFWAFWLPSYTSGSPPKSDGIYIEDFRTLLADTWPESTTADSPYRLGTSYVLRYVIPLLVHAARRLERAPEGVELGLRAVEIAEAQDALYPSSEESQLFQIRVSGALCQAAFADEAVDKTIREETARRLSEVLAAASDDDLRSIAADVHIGLGQQGRGVAKADRAAEIRAYQRAGEFASRFLRRGSVRPTVLLGNTVFYETRLIRALLRTGAVTEAVEVATRVVDTLGALDPSPDEAANASGYMSSFSAELDDIRTADRVTEAQRERVRELEGRVARLARELRAHVVEADETTLAPPIRPRTKWRSAEIRPMVKRREFGDHGEVADYGERVSWSSAPFMPGNWDTIEGRQLIKRVLSIDGQPELQGATIHRVRELPLAFYDDGALVEVEYTNAEGENHLTTWMVVRGDVVPLRGASTHIHETNRNAPIRLTTRQQALSYLRFFTSYLEGGSGSVFRIVEYAEELHWKAGAPDDVRASVSDVLRPLVVWEDPAKAGHWRATATLHYENAVFWAEFSVEPDGMVHMIDDAPVAADLPIDPPSLSRRGHETESRPPLDLAAIGISKPKKASEK